jgi:hypothetical protein
MWPTVQAGYSWLLDDGASISLGLESRTLQPALSFTTGGGTGGAAPGGVADFLPEGAAPTVRGALTVGVAWTISPQAYLEADAVARQLDAAVAGSGVRPRSGPADPAGPGGRPRDELDAPRTGRLRPRIAALERDAADARYAAGAASELERLRAHLTWRQAVLGYARARFDHLGSVLDTYTTYAIPLSEVLP